MTGLPGLFALPSPAPDLVSTAPPCHHVVVDVHEGRATCLACGPLSGAWIEDRQAEREAATVAPEPTPFDELLACAVRDRRERQKRLQALATDRGAP